MIFFFDKKAGNSLLEIEGENYTHIVKSRRAKTGDLTFFRNFEDSFLYTYKIENIERRKAVLSLLKKEKKIVESLKRLHIGWCVVDVKTVEKNLPYLSELGVEKITFIYSKRSQKNFKINQERIKKILVSSSCQCGRSSIIKIETANSLQEFIANNPKSAVLNFSENFLEKNSEISTVIVGPEGGFSSEDLEVLKGQKTYGLDSPLVLRSETATTAVASLILL